MLDQTASNKPYYTLVMHIIDVQSTSAMTCGQQADAELILSLLLTLTLIRYNVATSGPSTRDESGSESCLSEAHHTHPSKAFCPSMCLHVINLRQRVPDPRRSHPPRTDIMAHRFRFQRERSSQSDAGW
jgi:hypothetical protein